MSDHPTCSDCGRTCPNPFGPVQVAWLREHECEAASRCLPDCYQDGEVCPDGTMDQWVHHVEGCPAEQRGVRRG